MMLTFIGMKLRDVADLISDKRRRRTYPVYY